MKDTEKVTVTFEAEDGRKVIMEVTRTKIDVGHELDIQNRFEPSIREDDSSLYVGLFVELMNSIATNGDMVEASMDIEPVK